MKKKIHGGTPKQHWWPAGIGEEDYVDEELHEGQAAGDSKNQNETDEIRCKNHVTL